MANGTISGKINKPSYDSVAYEGISTSTASVLIDNDPKHRSIAVNVNTDNVTAGLAKQTDLNRETRARQEEIQTLSSQLSLEKSDRRLGDYQLAESISELDESLAKVAKTGKYEDLSGIPPIGEGVLTIEVNGSEVGTFSANAAENKELNIHVPTNNDELENGAGFVTAAYHDATKADSAALLAHIQNQNVHVSEADRTNWNSKEDAINNSHKLNSNFIDDSNSETNKFVNTYLLNKLRNIQEGAEPNKIDAINVNGHTLPIFNKNVFIDLPITNIDTAFGLESITAYNNQTITLVTRDGVQHITADKWFDGNIYLGENSSLITNNNYSYALIISPTNIKGRNTYQTFDLDGMDGILTLGSTSTNIGELGTHTIYKKDGITQNVKPIGTESVTTYEYNFPTNSGTFALKEDLDVLSQCTCVNNVITFPKYILPISLYLNCTARTIWYFNYREGKVERYGGSDVGVISINNGQIIATIDSEEEGVVYFEPGYDTLTYSHINPFDANINAGLDFTNLATNIDTEFVHKGTSSSPSDEEIYGEKTFIGHASSGSSGSKISTRFVNTIYIQSSNSNVMPLILSSTSHGIGNISVGGGSGALNLCLGTSGKILRGTNSYGAKMPVTTSWSADKTLAMDEDVVHKTGNETISGVKTFESDTVIEYSNKKVAIKNNGITHTNTGSFASQSLVFDEPFTSHTITIPAKDGTIAVIDSNNSITIGSTTITEQQLQDLLALLQTMQAVEVNQNNNQGE